MDGDASLWELDGRLGRWTKGTYEDSDDLKHEDNEETGGKES
jgi:hypothetical protein